MQRNQSKLMPRNKEDREASRLREVIGILVKHDIIKGLTPKKLHGIIEDLGPTFVKFGQIMSMRSDVIPKDFCDELRKLHSEVKPMMFEEVKEVIEDSLDESMSNLFARFDQIPLGSASIAQVHKAKLHTGEWIVVKVQRKGVKELMARDIKLLKKASHILKLTGGISDIMDFNTILEELWHTTQEELDFLIEASRLEMFYSNHMTIKYASCPKVYKHLTSDKVLIMEYIDGIPISHTDQLLEGGYDLLEIGRKLAENYSKQIMDDGLFHADPHPGNLMIRNGEIIWLDLGMMGTLSGHGRGLLLKFTESVVNGDVGGIKDVILSIGTAKDTVDHSLLYSDIDDILKKYGKMDFGGLDVSKYLNEVLDVALKHQISIPSSYTMLGRGLTNLEGVLELISPEINYMEIAGAHLSDDVLNNFNAKVFIRTLFSSVSRSFDKTLEIPGHINEILTMFMKGQSKVGMELQSTKAFDRLMSKLVNNLIIGLIISALLIGSSLIATTDMKPQVLDIPMLGALGYSVAFILSIGLLLDLRKSRKY